MLKQGDYMCKRFSILSIILILFISYPHYLAAASIDTQDILILNSYHSGFAWTDDQTKGISSSLSSLEGKYNLSIEYLDWKRYPSEAHLNVMYDSLKLKYAHKIIDIVICTDDAAFSFALKYREEIFSNAPIVFAGVNSEGLLELSQGEKNFTGVLETLAPESTVLTALNINPSIKDIYLIYDGTESGLSTGKLCSEAIQSIDPTLNIIHLNNISSTEILEIAPSIHKDSMVLVTTYFQDIDGSDIHHEGFCEELSKLAPVPIFHLYDFALGNGVFGGKLMSGKHHGEQAGTLAKRILNGEDASSIDIINTQTTQFTFDYIIFEKHNISKNTLPENTQFINMPFSFVETYRTLVYSVFLVFIMLTSFTMILLFYIKKIKTMQLKLAENNEELTQLYEELTASEEELRAQFMEVIDTQNQLEEYSSKLHHLAYHDALTGLYNRLYLYEEVEKVLSSNHTIGALFFIDLDNFKFVNDALGHNIGDELLKDIAKRLLNLASTENTLIRLGGDEFVFLTRKLENKEQAKKFAHSIINQFKEPFTLKDNCLSLTISVGIAIFPENGHNINTLLRNADMAMYKVKNSGKNGSFFFNNHLKEELLFRVMIENNFKKALEKEEFNVYYQPQINIHSNEIDGFEALIRWNSPELGMLSPLKFIPIAEETGFITTLGEWILRSSCAFIKDLNARKNTTYKISVNISVIQLLQDHFVDVVKGVLEDTSLEPDLLELEITESVIMESPELVAEKIRTLRAIGVRVALDDFGTGYSSLSYLRNIPITTLKIDKLFVDDIASPCSNTDVTDTIIDLGHKMNLTIVAEGVETDEQLQYLKENGCDKIQGYLFSKPLPISELESMLENTHFNE
jgi:diguanylate cyclase (GGDEF)-like protein